MRRQQDKKKINQNFFQNNVLIAYDNNLQYISFTNSTYNVKLKQVQVLNKENTNKRGNILVTAKIAMALQDQVIGFQWECARRYTTKQKIKYSLLFF